MKRGTSKEKDAYDLCIEALERDDSAEARFQVKRIVPHALRSIAEHQIVTSEAIKELLAAPSTKNFRTALVLVNELVGTLLKKYKKQIDEAHAVWRQQMPPRETKPKPKRVPEGQTVSAEQHPGVP